ncbi:BCCT family transporter [Corynebacterium atypicum]|uniref:BCCT family transporter n=1 Tax=Corynebacterium atypicum TaxID=191610 RepID=UPI00068B1E65|nr:BCCT family transporter [Corynebacterium atypicum]
MDSGKRERRIVTEFKRTPARKPRRASTRRAGRIHPVLIPGIGVEKTGVAFPTNRLVFAMALVVTLAVFAWAALAPDNLNEVGTQMREWVTSNLGWMFTFMVLAIMIFMLVIAIGPTGGIKLGTDEEEPEYSRASWISMLFAAGLGIGLIFYGPMEPLTHFIDAPPASDAPSATVANILPAISQALFHQTLFTWAIYAVVGGAIAYATYRRGRLPLISALFEPIFPNGPHRVIGRVIDIFALLVTLFGTATSLGIGALQIQAGTQIVTGWDTAGNTFIIVSISVLTALFILSAVTGVKKGIRFLSNVNMGLVIFMALFVLVFGPTVFILDLMPSAFVDFVGRVPELFSVFPSQGGENAEFMTTWTTMYWAWWLSWSPFVGMFIAKISRGRTIREYVFVVIFAPGMISVAWYVIFGGAAISQVLNSLDLKIKDSGENVMFDLLGNLPASTILQVLTLVAILIFFVTAADSATVVMGSMSQNGRPVPTQGVSVVWGLALGLVALFLLLAGGQNALSGLQAVMVTCSVPFVVILLAAIVCWILDLRTDPLMIRSRYADRAVAKGVHRGIEKYGDDFVFETAAVGEDEGAGSEFESENPAYTQWYTSNIDSQGVPYGESHEPRADGRDGSAKG